jgi:hypothetical protein
MIARRAAAGIVALMAPDPRCFDRSVLFFMLSDSL